MSATRLVIGPGYLGGRVATMWKAQGCKVHVTTRKRERFGELTRLGFEAIEWDVLGGEKNLPRVDEALYSIGFDRAGVAGMREVYVEGLKRTLAHLPPTKMFIYISSTGVYGDAGGDWVDELTVPNPADESGRICLEAEEVLREHSSETGRAFQILRLAGIYGPGRLIGGESLREGKPIPGDPEAFINLVHVEDAARVVDAAIRRGQPGSTYIVSDGRPVTRRELYAFVARQMGAPEPVFDWSAAKRWRGNRRLRNDRMMVELAPELLFPDARAGLTYTFA